MVLVYARLASVPKIKGEGMKEVLIVGSIGLDNLKTPYGQREEVLGGSVSYASVSARTFSPVSMIGVVGQDFPQEHLDFFRSREINIDGLEIKEGKTFRWSGEYKGDMNEAQTLETQLNAFASFSPSLSDEHSQKEFLFLGNIHPSLQLNVLDQMKDTQFVMCDTMNLWINTTRDELLEVISRVNLMLLNDKEAKMLCDTENLVLAAQKILNMGPDYVVIKKGEHGSMLFSKSGEMFAAPAFPLSQVKDPTGAGDTFAGGFIGFLAQDGEVSFDSLKRATVAGTIMASFTAQDFSLDMLRTVSYSEFVSRFEKFEDLTSFNSLSKVPDKALV